MSLRKNPKKFPKRNKNPKFSHSTQNGNIAYIGIGSNLGDKIAHCEKAISEILKADQNKLIAKSSFFKTKPLCYTSQDWFVNGVIKIETELEPLQLLRALKRIEFSGRDEETFRSGTPGH